METVPTDEIKKHILKFKSYYVVWKPSFSALIFSAIVVFKSYYVVWKQYK